jgi:hypothetical protein
LIFAAGGSQDQQAHDGERCAGGGEGGVKKFLVIRSIAATGETIDKRARTQ